MIEAPLPSGVPPHDPEYHTQFADVPRVPVGTVNVVELPTQIAVGDAAAVGSVERVATVTVTLTQLVLLHVPSALAK